jgi:hypothetical protein
MLSAKGFNEVPDQDFGDDGRENAVDEDSLDEELEDDLDDDGGAVTSDEVETIREGLE